MSMLNAVKAKIPGSQRPQRPQTAKLPPGQQAQKLPSRQDQLMNELARIKPNADEKLLHQITQKLVKNFEIQNQLPPNVKGQHVGEINKYLQNITKMYA